MAQVPPQHCPRCGTEIVPEQKFCATCGLPRALQNTEQQALPLFNPVPPSGKRKIGRNGIVLLSVALLLILIALGYIVLQSFGVGKPAQAPITRTAINTTITYASTDLTILNMQQSQNFLDDPHTTQDGMVRLQIQAKNTSGQPVALAYKNIAHIVLSSGKEVTAVYASGNPTVVAGATQTSNIDFTLPTGGKVDLVRLGAANEAQMDVPLHGHADVSKYATKTIKVSKQLTYLNIDWTLVDATSQLSFNGQQANKGMRYITVTFSVSNPLMETVIPGSPYVYIHLKAGTSETAPINANMPVSFDAATSGKTGTATFQIPQDSSTLTLTLGAAGSTGFDPVTAIFQL